MLYDIDYNVTGIRYEVMGTSLDSPNRQSFGGSDDARRLSPEKPGAEEATGLFCVPTDDLTTIALSPLTKTDPFSLTKTNPAAAAGFSEGVAA